MEVKFQLLQFYLIFFYTICYSQNTFVPDDNFEQTLIDLGYDIGPLDDNVPTANINSLTSLDVSNRFISDLTGIEDFISLEQFFCNNNNLTNLNVSQNLALETLWCNANFITNLDVTNNVNLLSLICNNNNLTAIDISNNNVLNTFDCSFNEITSLNISQNLQLDFFSCSNNQINSLDVSQNLNLRQLRCAFNLLTMLNVSNNTALDNLYCNNNLLTSLNISNAFNLTALLCQNNSLEKLDVSNNNQLVYLECQNNNLCTLDLRNGNNLNLVFLDAKLNSGLACVFVDDVNFSSVNWSNYINSSSNFVASESECNSVNPLTPQVDVLNDFNGVSYTLPLLVFGTYYTQPGGIGNQLNTGDVITSNQKIYIYNTNGCFENESSFNVYITDTVFIPKFFTPNNDGENDTWKIVDVNNLVNNITIYNRYGKLLKFLFSNTEGWDGTFKNTPLINDSYWYVIVLNDRTVLKGYFALKR